MDIEKEHKAFEEYISDLGLVEFADWNFKLDECGEYIHEPTNISWGIWRQKQAEIDELKAKLESAKSQTWISVEDSDPSTNTEVLVCWSNSPDIDPDIDYMTIDEDCNPYWANYHNDVPTHWMPIPKLPHEAQEQE